jgi:DNA-binding LacI/PurR family transcriptional regulator
MSDIALWRRDACIAWLTVRGVYDPLLISQSYPWEYQDLMEVVAAWRSLSMPPTAIFCANDNLALAVLAAARRLQWHVPVQLSVVGVDNHADAAASEQPLTSVEIPAENIGEGAVRALLDLIRGEPLEACRVTLPVTNFVVRATTAPAPTTMGRALGVQP